jgi:hypothetical protein
VGDVYIATHTGIQILRRPWFHQGNRFPHLERDGVSNVFFAGSDLRWLYATDGEQMFRLHL